MFWGIGSSALAQGATEQGVHINEFLPNPAGNDSEFEFIELLNDSDHDIDVSGWSIDTGGSFTFSLDAGTIIAPAGFLTFFSAQKKISLTNSGDRIQLLQAGGAVQDDIVFTGSEEERSYIRTVTGAYEGGNIPTPNTANAIASPTPSSSPSPTPTPSPVFSYSSDIHINEFLPDAAGDDAAGEFIELYNADIATVDISGWVLDDIENGGSSPFTIPDDTSVAAHGFYVFSRVQTKLSMNNDSDHVRFIRPDAVVQDDVSYADAREAHSYNRISAGVYEKSSTITSNATNIITAPSTPTPKPSVAAEEEQEGDSSYEFSLKIVINELLPNPVGSDVDSEFIELKSEDTRSISLLGWTLDDAAGGSSPYHFTESDSIIAGKILVLFRTKTKIALNNDEDAVRLIDPNGKIISSVAYKEKIIEGQSYNRTPAGLFAWSEILTPNEENIIRIQEKVSPTPKPKTVKKSTTPKKATSSKKLTPLAGSGSVLSATTTLPWPEPTSEEGVVSRTVVSSARFPDSKQKAFIFFGVTVACIQGLSGFSHKERIWQK